MTDLIEWKSEMSVGVAILDEDHKRIMKMINKLHAAMMDGSSKKIMGEILHNMIVYINLHFESEEDLFDQTGYGGAEDQKQQHAGMRAKTLSMNQKFNEAPDSVRPVEILVFLKDWWIDHIMNKDMKYAAHLNSQGIR